MRCYWQYDGVCWVADCGNEHSKQDEAIFGNARIVDGACPYCGREIEE